MPLCQMRFAPVIYLLFFYGIYMLLVFPAVELCCYLLRTFANMQIGSNGEVTRYIYEVCLITFFPCYAMAFYISWRRHRAKVLFTPKWKTCEPLVEDDVQCTICYDLIVDPHTLRCQHSFCKKCIDQCLPLTRRCPSCQQWVYWSKKNRMYKAKVLKWVQDNGRDEEYEEVKQLKAAIKPAKAGCWAKCWPFILPFFEAPQRQNRNNDVHLRHINRAVVEPVPPRQPETMVVNMVDEVDFTPVSSALVVPHTLSVIIEVPEDLVHDSVSPRFSASSSFASIPSIISEN